LVDEGFPDRTSCDAHIEGWTEILHHLATLAKAGFAAYGIAQSMREMWRSYDR
jgi:hypothetical protein